jgi:hypothetical protein
MVPRTNSVEGPSAWLVRWDWKIGAQGAVVVGVGWDILAAAVEVVVVERVRARCVRRVLVEVARLVDLSCR